MNKNEQNRLVAWRLRVLRQADEVPRGVAHDAGADRKYARRPAGGRNGSCRQIAARGTHRLSPWAYYDFKSRWARETHLRVLPSGAE
jgi:hypothetical protein